MLDLRGGPGDDKENATDESLSASPSQSPPRAMVLHQNPLSLETPPSSPGKCTLSQIYLAQITASVLASSSSYAGPALGKMFGVIANNVENHTEEVLHWYAAFDDI